MIEKSLNWKWVLAALIPIAYLVMLCYQHLDRPIAFWANDLPDWFTAFFKTITHLGQGYLFIVLFIIVLIFMHLIYPSDAWRRRIIFSICSLLMTIVLIYPLKVSFGRLRPGPLLNNNQYAFEPFSRFDLGGSLPSGHTADITALCLSMCLWFKHPAWRGVLITIMLLVAVSRVVIAWHFLGDIIVGFYIGFIAVYLAHLMLKKPLKLDESPLSGS